MGGCIHKPLARIIEPSPNGPGAYISPSLVSLSHHPIDAYISPSLVSAITQWADAYISPSLVSLSHHPMGGCIHKPLARIIEPSPNGPVHT